MARKPVPGAALLKPRPTNSELKEPTKEFQPWDSAPAMVTRVSQDRISHKHYALIYLDEAGQVQYEFSLSMQPFRNRLFPVHLKGHFLQCANKAPVSGSTIPRPLPRLYGANVPTRKPSIPLKRQRLQQYMEESDSEEDFQDDPGDRIGLQIGDEARIIAYYEDALKAFQQLNCRQIAKAYIKAIEPRKQANFPYNGGKVAPGEQRDPEKTRPPWWPIDVIHREPDHLRKTDRIKLLIHILRNLGEKGVTVGLLREAGEEVQQRQVQPPEKSAVLEEIYRVREWEERYERGQIDATTLVYVTIRKDTKHHETRASESPSDSGECCYQSDPQSRQSTSPAVQEHNLVTSPVDPKDPIFPLPTPTTFEPNHSFVSMPGVKAEYEQPTNPPNMNYLSGLPTSSAQTHHMDQRCASPGNQAASAYSWSSAPFQPPVFNPVDYGNGTCTSMVPQYMPHSMSMMVPPQSHGPFSLPDLHGARSQQMEDVPMVSPPLQFRTGSLSHPHLMASHHTGVNIGQQYK
ncbi:hypothetical protein FQN55_000461 [Onygenales sp. PD_40]|nr:hypothetical protein FQN55_000461 [Onygenales sp. PD_40]